jgi:hypothetical protein
MVEHYAGGGRTIASSLHRGIGHDNPNKRDAVHGFTLTAGQKSADRWRATSGVEH